MKLEQLRPNICELPQEEGFQLFLAYYEQRSIDIVRPVQTGRKKAAPKKKKEKALKLTADQKAALKALGLI